MAQCKYNPIDNVLCTSRGRCAAALGTLLAFAALSQVLVAGIDFQRLLLPSPGVSAAMVIPAAHWLTSNSIACSSAVTPFLSWSSQTPPHTGGPYLQPGTRASLVIGTVDVRVSDFGMGGNGTMELCDAVSGIRRIVIPSTRCADEDADAVGNRSATLLFGEYELARGYDLRLVGPSIIWAPLTFAADRHLTARLQLVDPGEYVVEVHRSRHEHGCQHADCDADVCPGKVVYSERMRVCGAGAPSPCAVLVGSWPVTVQPRNATATPRPLPMCTLDSLGREPGRWVSTAYLRTRGQETWFGDPATAWAWQPFACDLPGWMDVDESAACLDRVRVLFIGLSRERTTFFDFLDLAGRAPAEYSKLMEVAQVGDLYYASVYFSMPTDFRTWNVRSDLAATAESLVRNIETLQLCNGAAARPLHIVFTVEEMWLVENALRSRWAVLTTRLLTVLRETCPNATLHYKTATTIRNALGPMSWHRMFDATRVSMTIARQNGVDVTDSFQMTQPWVTSDVAFPDGVHLFSQTRFQGNFVSKTVSQLILLQVCNSTWQSRAHVVI